MDVDILFILTYNTGKEVIQMKYITRVVPRTVITARTITVGQNGNPEIEDLPNVEVSGDLTKSHARMMKEYLAIFPQYKGNLIINGCLVQEKRQMALDVFIENSVIVEEQDMKADEQ